MTNRKKDNSKTTYCSFLDSIFYKPVTMLTEFLLKNDNTQIPTDSFSVGISEDPYNKNKTQKIYLNLSHLLRHTYILGQSGSGKTYLILHMLMSLVNLNMGFCVIDIHGDLSRMIFNYICSKANDEAELARISKKVVLIEPFNRSYAPAFNPLFSTNTTNLYSEAYDMLGIFKKIWKDVSWGARMEELLRNLLLTLSLTKSSLLEANRFLTDSSYREKIVDQLTDYEIKYYWTDRFGALSERMKPVYIEPVANKLSIFTSDPYIRHILAQEGSEINFRRFMDEGKWVIVNISKGALSENAHLLGSLFISKIKSSALSRADIQESLRVPFYLFVDEFQNFMGYNFEEILSEARKYKLGLVLAHQNLSQIEKTMRESIFANVYNNLFFKLSHNDMKEVSNAFTSAEKSLLQQVLLTLNVGEAVYRIPDGTFRKTKINHIHTAKDNQPSANRLKNICYEKYYGKRSDIDRKLLSNRINNSATIISSNKVKVITKRIIRNGIEEGTL